MPQTLSPTKTRAGHLSRVARLGLALGLLGPLCVQCTSPTAKDALVRFDSCDELQAFFEERLLHPQSGGLTACENSDALLRAPGAEGEGEGRIFTTTNTQEVDVDEPDFVKNNGDHIFVLRRDRMIIVDAWPPIDAHVVSETPIAGVPFTMFFDGEGRAMVFARNSEGEGTANTTMSLFDVSDPAAPALRREVKIAASYVDARRVGDEVVVVTRSTIGTEAELRRDAFRDDENRAALRALGVTGLVPTINDRQFGAEAGESEAVIIADVGETAVNCKNTWAPRQTSSTTLLMAHTISIADERAPIGSTSVVGTPGNVYASRENLYLVGTEVYDGGHFTPDFGVTRIHKLGAFQDGAAVYKGSAVVEGSVRDELSVDEDEAGGTLRVVLTLNDDINDSPTANSTSLVVFAEGDAAEPELVEVGRVDDIGHGEVVESVRFFGERAYVVTFPAGVVNFEVNDSGVPEVPFVDPLFVVDLSDARQPRLRGALEVEGYSAYIHPLDADHLLTVGANVDVNSGNFTGLQVSIFNVANADAPTLLHRTSFGDVDSGSEALVERHAFTYFPAQKTLALPWQRVDLTEVAHTALAVFDVDVEVGFDFKGLVDQLPLYQAGPEPLRSEEAPCGAVRRSIMMDDPDLGAYVYAVSTAGISVAALDDGVPIVSNVAFPPGAICDFTGSPL